MSHCYRGVGVVTVTVVTDLPAGEVRKLRETAEMYWEMAQ